MRIIKKISDGILNGIVRDFYKFYFSIRKNSLSKYQENTICKIRDNSNINVVFFVNSKAKWQYEGVYNLFNSDSRFTPYVVVVPNTSFGIQNGIDGVYETLNDFKGYRCISSYVECQGYIDIKKVLRPDIVFFSEPSGGHWLYKPFNFFKASLCCYVPYCYNIFNSYQKAVKKDFYTALWLSFTESRLNQQVAEKYSVLNSNFIYSGYPPMDEFIIDSHNKEDTKYNSNLKKIIWAPHHTIDSNDNSASFLKFYGFFIYLAKKYSNKIELIFKPHPLLKNKLYIYWGKEKTDSYYNSWDVLENTSRAEGDYIELFKASDALIHDGLSFAVEYLFVNKPICFTLTNPDFLKKLNELGYDVINASYKENSKQGIVNFIEMVISGADPMQQDRVKLLSDNLLPPNNKTASENIYNSIVDRIS